MVRQLLVRALTPLALEAALAVAEGQLATRADDADCLRAAAVEPPAPRYQSDLARRRYLAVHPDNRLVATSLEADWNASLRDLAEATDTYEKTKGDGVGTLDPPTPQCAQSPPWPATSPRLWNDPATPVCER